MEIHLPLGKVASVLEFFRCRPWNRFDKALFQTSLQSSVLCDSQFLSTYVPIDELANTYDSVLSGLLDRILPIATMRRRINPLVPWFDSDCVAAKWLTRLLERKSISNPGDPISRFQWLKQKRKLHNLYKAKAQDRWRSVVGGFGGDSRARWRSLDKLLGRKSASRGSTDSGSAFSVGDFIHSFTQKVNDIRSYTASASRPVIAPYSAECRFSEFTLVTPSKGYCSTNQPFIY